MDIKDAIDKVQKLLRLSTSDNQNEAAAALKAAQEMITKYQIKQDMLDAENGKDDEEEEDVVDFGTKSAPLDTASEFNLERWRIRLAGAICDANQCGIYVYSHYDNKQRKMLKSISVIGRPSDVEKVRYLFQYFFRETERLCERDGKGCGKVWRNQFRHGVVDTLSTALRESKKTAHAQVYHEAMNNRTALVVVDRAIAKIEKRGATVTKFMDDMKLKNLRSVPNHRDPDARQQGREAGEEIHLTEARGALK